MLGKKVYFKTIVNRDDDRPLIAGIDEAGRGPVIGPMVIACVALPQTNGCDEIFVELGVKDSKLLSRKRREELFEEIVGLSTKIAVAYIPPKTIDEWVLKKRYNFLEAQIISQLLVSIPQIKVAYIDAPSSPEDFKKKILHYLGPEIQLKLIVEKQADKKYPIVSAASIIAKVLRDRIIDKIKSEIGIDFGSGYPSDPKTQQALSSILKTRPDIVRRSWKTVRKKNQTDLTLFFEENKLK